MKQQNFLQYIVGIVLVGLVLATFVLVYKGKEPVSTGPREQINVNGDAQFEIAPDEATIYISVETNGSTAQQAEEKNSKIMTDIKNAMLKEGVSEKDLETTGYNLYPWQEWEQDCPKDFDFRYPCPGKNVNKGYRVTHTLKVTTSELTKVGTLLDRAIGYGATNIQNVQFGLSKAKEDEARDQALRDATKKARNKAEAIADGLGADLGKVISAGENFIYTPYQRYLDVAEVAMIKESGAGSLPPISPSNVMVSAQVNVAYELK